MRGELLNSEDYYQFVMTESEGYFGKQINNKWVNLWNVATKSDLGSMYQGFSVKRSDNMSDYDSNYSSGGFRILYGIIVTSESVAIISFDISWIRLQFMVSVDYIKIRRGYGASGFTEWKTILP